jgi:hypothetical protein
LRTPKTKLRVGLELGLMRREESCGWR